MQRNIVHSMPLHQHADPYRHAWPTHTDRPLPHFYLAVCQKYQILKNVNNKKEEDGILHEFLLWWHNITEIH